MRSRAEYSRELKLKVVKEYEEGHKNTREIKEEYGIPDSTLWGWINKYRAEGESAFEPKLRAGDFIVDPTKIPPVLYKEIGLDRIKKDPRELKGVLNEIEKYKLIIAEKELEIRLLKEALKKTRKG